LLLGGTKRRYQQLIKLKGVNEQTSVVQGVEVLVDHNDIVAVSNLYCGLMVLVQLGVGRHTSSLKVSLVLKYVFLIVYVVRK
jgi:hypothetical protein